MPRRSARLQAAIVKSASEDELSAVSHESCSTPMMKPTATTCIAVFWSMPKRPQASGISMSDAAGTAEAPAAQTAAMKERKIAVGMSTVTPSENAAERVSTVIVIARPPC